MPIAETICKEGKTKPKAYFTEDTLLSAMERAGAYDHPISYGTCRYLNCDGYLCRSNGREEAGGILLVCRIR